MCSGNNKHSFHASPVVNDTQDSAKMCEVLKPCSRQMSPIKATVFFRHLAVCINIYVDIQRLPFYQTRISNMLTGTTSSRISELNTVTETEFLDCSEPALKRRRID